MIDQQMLASILSGVGKGLLAPPVAGQSNLQAAGQGLAGSLEQDMLRRQQEQAQQEALAREDALRQEQFARADAETARKQANKKTEFELDRDRIGISRTNAETNANQLKRSTERDKVLDERWQKEFGFRKSKFAADTEYRKAQLSARDEAKRVQMQSTQNFVETLQNAKNPAAKRALTLISTDPSLLPAARAEYAKKVADFPEQKRISDRFMRSMEDTYNRNKDQLARADELSNAYFTTGFEGFIGSLLPGSTSFDINSIMNSIRARLGFDELQKMRDNSPTGGALGQITERELGFLQATIEELSNSVSKKEFKTKIAKLKQHFDNIYTFERQAYEKDLASGLYGDKYVRDIERGATPTMAPVEPQQGGADGFSPGFGIVQ